MDRLSIRTLGQAEVTLGGQPVQWRAASARSLFFYLLTYPGGKSRTEIINALWDAEPDALLGNRFRVVVHRARAALGAKDRLVEEHNRYHLSAEVLSASDVQSFDSELEQANRDPFPARKTARLEHLLNAYQGDYLPLETADWARQGREEHRAVYAQAQIELSELQCEAGTCSSSVESLVRALHADPYLGENHHQRLMTCLSVVEDKYAATAHYRRFVSFLRHEFNDAPMPETLDLAERIKGGEYICQRQTHEVGSQKPYHCPFSANQPCHIIPNAGFPDFGRGTLPLLH